MRVFANLVVLLVAMEHFAFMALEMFFWDHPIGRQIFNMTPEVSASSATLAANQGLYNGFLAVGLLWGLLAGRKDIKLFFLGCIVVAGIYGGISVKETILFTQAFPALIGLALVSLTRKISSV